MINFYLLLKTIYTKEVIVDFEEYASWGMCVTSTKALGKQKDNLDALAKIVPDLFVGSPKNYIYRLYCDIPAKPYVPKSFKIDKEDLKLDKLQEAIKDIFSWSISETQKNKIITNLILSKEDKKSWKKELSV